MQTRATRNRSTQAVAGLWSESGGATLVFTAMVLGALVGSAALAVDLGMLISARVQSQRAADAGALAGAGVLTDPSALESEARSEAKAFANRHNVLSNPVTVGDADVDVDMVNDEVTVRVHHAVATLFARIFWIEEVNVSTLAAARAAPAGGSTCPLPIAAVDRWTDSNDNGIYDAGEPYTPCTGGSCTGYGTADEGELIEVKTWEDGDAKESTEGVDQTCLALTTPEWYCWIRPETAPPDHTVLIDIVDGCTNWDLQVAIGELVYAAPANKQEVTKHIADFVDDNDPSHHWDSSQQCVADGSGSCVESSGRIRGLALVDPSSPSGSEENATAMTSNLAAVFVEKVATAPDEPHRGGPEGEWNVYARLVADGGGEGTGPNDDALLSSIVLVK